MIHMHETFDSNLHKHFSFVCLHMSHDKIITVISVHRKPSLLKYRYSKSMLEIMHHLNLLRDLWTLGFVSKTGIKLQNHRYEIQISVTSEIVLYPLIFQSGYRIQLQLFLRGSRLSAFPPHVFHLSEQILTKYQWRLIHRTVFQMHDLCMLDIHTRRATTGQVQWPLGRNKEKKYICTNTWYELPLGFCSWQTILDISAALHTRWSCRTQTTNRLWWCTLTHSMQRQKHEGERCFQVQ